ncbi:hypothetical protein IIB79_05720 [candidate division KSB1 bacterium]|nr:hypothetical protein [candidate division KSB1 bacterium]
MNKNKNSLPKLLIADEDEDLSKSLALVFSDKFDVRIANDSPAFNAELESAVYLLIDVNIVENKGIDFLISIREKYPNTFIILMDKAVTKRSQLRTLYKRYSDASVFKPFDAEYIQKLVTRLGAKTTNSSA